MPGASSSESLVLRGYLGSHSTATKLARLRREHRIVDLLPRRHDGHPKGAPLQPSLDAAAHHGRALPDALNISARDAILPVVPMFHVNAGGLPYVGPMVGAKIVYRGRSLTASPLRALRAEKVTCSAGVPTVWQGLLAYMEANALRFTTMSRT